MPASSLLRRILLPELELTRSWFFSGHDHTHLEVRKTSTLEVCPRCATPSSVIYDHRVVDGRRIASCLSQLEEVLRTSIVTELQSLRRMAA